uniref:Uncharacterized protein n=1 Tax=Anopheles minimus TaxID=112268 RepID=A0A182W0X1_9DIPT
MKSSPGVVFAEEFVRVLQDVLQATRYGAIAREYRLASLPVGTIGVSTDVNKVSILTIVSASNRWVEKSHQSSRRLLVQPLVARTNSSIGGLIFSVNAGLSPYQSLIPLGRANKGPPTLQRGVETIAEAKRVEQT